MTNPPAPSLSWPALDDLLSQSPQAAERPTTCCCGRDGCAYLAHNNFAIEGLEKDLQSAAKIGQALLSRHEAYIAEAEEERRRVAASIDGLDGDKKRLEAENAKTIEENRYLLDQLEQMNNTLASSDAQILSLNKTLQSTRKEVERLTFLAARTSELEMQLAKFEKGQEDLQIRLGSKDEQERTAVQRWKSAERTINTLQQQIDRIEREAIEEKAKHTEVVARFERRSVVERELGNAAGRLKGAAAATTREQNGNNNVVSHFVSEILQDNANLQLGIFELREMLMGSNQEVENLREQILQHQPSQQRPDATEGAASLDTELARAPKSEAVPDLHVHHHYHAPSKVEVKEKLPSSRRAKRRNITSPGLRTPSSGTQTPRSPHVRAKPASTAATILSQTSVSIPPPATAVPSRNWSMQSSQPSGSVAASSYPNSPRSTFRSSSIFDTIDDVPDSSRPTTPGSTNLGSPMIKPWQSKRSSDASAQSLPTKAGVAASKATDGVVQDAEPNTKNMDSGFDDGPFLEHSIILEEPEEDCAERPSTQDSGPQNFVDDHFSSMQPIRSRLHRANSHESILSTRNVDIPKLRTKGSQMLTKQGFTPRTSLGTSSTSVDPITSSTSAIVRPSKTARGYDSSNYNRLLLQNPSTASPSAEINPVEKSTLGKRVGGWMFGKWGNMPTASTGNLKAKDALGALSERTEEKKTENVQSSRVEPVKLDDSLLKESLSEPLKGRSFGV